MAHDSHDKHEGDHGGGGGGGHKSHAPHGGGHEEGHEGAPEWLISFADNVALMMGFFVVMLAMNMAKQTTGGVGGSEKMGGQPVTAEMLDFTIAVREAFNNPVDIDSTDPRDQVLVRRLIERAGRSDTATPGIEGFDHDVQSLRPKNPFYALGGSVPFADGSTTLMDSASSAIKKLARKVRGRTAVVEVRGHASAAEAARGRVPAMRLANERAIVVAEGLADEGVDWWQMRLVVCADHDRVVAFPSDRGDDEANARVEVVLKDEIVPDKVPTRHGEDGGTAE